MKAIITIGTLIGAFAIGSYGYKQYDAEGYAAAEKQVGEAVLYSLEAIGLIERVPEATLVAPQPLKVPLDELSENVDPTVEVVPLEQYTLPFITEKDV